MGGSFMLEADKRTHRRSVNNVKDIINNNKAGYLILNMWKNGFSIDDESTPPELEKEGGRGGFHLFLGDFRQKSFLNNKGTTSKKENERKYELKDFKNYLNL